MSNPRLDLSSKDELISNLLNGNKPTTTKNDTPISERKTFKVQSDLLSRLEDFLPKIKEANAQLDQQLREDPKAVDIENVDEESGEQYIEMDLGLGVFDLKKDVDDDEEKIIMNPSEIKKPSEPTVKPKITMMDIDKDRKDGDSASEELAKDRKIPKGNSHSSDDEDIVMS
ncbi:hypothetical protein BGZ76_006066 [Entomortierella beljakovae]|nr:hypothetical protein BGZ76_006066 [Entomortierella beljakovae]